MGLRPLGHPDLDHLLNTVIRFAKQMPAKHGEFYPFGATMGVNGRKSGVGGYTGNERPPVNEVIDLLQKGFRHDAQSQKIRATALCLNVSVNHPRTGVKTDAIRVTLEHAGGDAVNVFLPYRISENRSVEYGQLFASKARPTIFGPPSAA